MKKLITFSVIVGILILVFVSLHYIKDRKANLNITHKIVGGPCSYSDYGGIATIIAVKKTEKSKVQADMPGGPGYEGFEVWVRLRADKEIKEKWARDFIKKEHLFQLYNGWYPGPEYIEKYKIKPGQTYKCTVKVITKGTCTPIIFEFDKFKKDDYFEANDKHSK